MPRIIKTQRYENDLKRIYRHTFRQFGLTVVQETKRQIDELEAKLEAGNAFIRHDDEYHAKRFSYLSIRNRQKVFFEVVDDTIYLVTAGYDRRDWKKHLKDLESYADEQVSKISKSKKSLNN